MKQKKSTVKYTKFLSYKKIHKDVCVVSGRGLSLRRHIVIPAEVKKGFTRCRVVGVAYRAFEDQRSLRSVTFPASMTAIGDAAFRGCTRLKRIRMEAGTESIGAEAFAECKRLFDLTLPESLSSIGHGAFRGCRRLTALMIPGFRISGCDGMAPDAFYGCDRLTAISYKGYSRVLTVPLSPDQGLSLPPEDWRDGVLYEDGWAVRFEGYRDRDYMLDRDTVGIASDAMEACVHAHYPDVTDPDSPADTTAIVPVELDYPKTRADWEAIQKPHGRATYLVRVKTLDGVFEETI